MPLPLLQALSLLRTHVLYCHYWTSVNTYTTFKPIARVVLSYIDLATYLTLICCTSTKRITNVTSIFKTVKHFTRKGINKSGKILFRVIRSQFHQNFMSTFCANILAPKNYKAKLKLEKSFAKHFWTKKAWVKSWWNWHLEDSLEIIRHPAWKECSPTGLNLLALQKYKKN